MFWFGRPPYWRWVTAILLVAVAGFVEFRPQPTVLHPFAADAAAAGEAPEIEWREVPAGMLMMPNVEGVASHALRAGEPLSPSDLVSSRPVPDGWWALAVELPAMVAPGTEVQLVLTEAAGAPVPGIVIGADELDGGVGAGPIALVAVPAEQAGRVVTAATNRSLAVLIAP